MLHSTLWEIKQDGTGDFTTIQEGIDASVNSDTVLVYPGSYFENLILTNNQAIALGSLYLTSGDESYIAQTILDGNQSSSVIRIEDITSPYYQTKIAGFIIQNGIGYTSGTMFPHKKKGGGLNIDEAEVIIEKCIIQYNQAWTGGGIYQYNNSYILLKGNTIRYNEAFHSGGGICMVQNNLIHYSTESLNNIYLNYAATGNDILVSHWGPIQEIIVDTFTVADPAEGYYYIYPASGGGGYPQPGLFSIDIQHAKIEQVNSNLYVSPNGNNNNSGISEVEPLQSIAYALAKIRSDSLNHNTIHVADGVYSPSLNNQHFPLHIKSYVDLIGESRENTILDAEFGGGQIHAYDPQRDYSVKNFSFINSSFQKNVIVGENTNVFFDNIRISNDNFGDFGYSAFHMNFSDVEFNNIIFENNQYPCSIYLYSPKYGTELKISNSFFINNEPSSFACKQIYAYRSTGQSDSLVVNIINSEFTDNLDSMFEWQPATSAIIIDHETKLNLINCTIGNNHCTEVGAALNISRGSEANIVNSIINGNTPYNLCLQGTYIPCILNANNSLVEGGVSGILQYGNNFINWDDATMLDEDPLWLGAGYEWPYALAADSPCINTGTLELPYGVELPAYDLAGNPRVMGSNIDMGAYEFPGNAAPIYLEMDNEILSWQMPAGFSATEYNIYLDDMLQATQTSLLSSYTFSWLSIGDTYKAGVSALYSTEETAVIPHYFTYNPVGIEEEIINPSSLIHNLSNYPNPFNPETVISYNLLESGKVNLSIYNIKGQKVKQLINAQLSSGSYSVSWNGKDTTDKRVSSGEYFAKLKVNGEEVAVNKMLLLK